MPRLMRRRLLCFYCGGRSTQEYLPTMHLWQCEICDAPNHLDEQGEITDPPPLESLPQPRFAQAVPRPSSPEFGSPDESLFCQTCLQNQRFLTETLASYFPPPNDPEYAEYEKNYPEYRKNLEDRYPQVCHKCEPRVRNRIRITGYAAKTDHLRRMMERSRGSGRNYHVWTWKRLALFIGAVGWYTSIAVQLLWNFGGALLVEGDERADGLRDDTSPSIPSCLALSWTSGQPTVGCVRHLDALAGLALWLGFFSIWWNPRFKQRLDRGSGRISGLTEYYKIQFILLALRLGLFVALTRSPVYDFDAGTRRALHSFTLLFTLIAIMISFRSVQIDLTPRVLFNDSPAPLIPQPQDISDERAHDQSSQGQKRLHGLKTRSAAFSLSDFAPNHSHSQALPYNPPTPPSNEDEFEEMDWTPSQQSLTLQARYRATPPKVIQPSPFYGRLPPAPLSQAHKLRNPPNQPTFRQATLAQKQSFFSRGRTRLDTDDQSEASSECFNSPGKSIMKSEVSSPKFAEPRFFPQSDYDRDTGLESIFSTAFTIDEEPHELRVARELKQRSADGPSHEISLSKLQAISLVTLASSFTAWIFALYIPGLAVYIRPPCLGVATLVAGRGLFETIRKGKVYWKWSDMFVYGLELCASTVLAKINTNFSRIKVKNHTDEASSLGTLLLGIMLLQELWIWWASKLHPTLIAPATVSTTSEEPLPLSAQPSAPKSKPTALSNSKMENQKPVSFSTPPVVVARPRHDPALLPSSSSFDRRTTRSISKRDEMNAMAANGRLLGGDGRGGRGHHSGGVDHEEVALGSLTLSERGAGVRARRR